MRSWRSSRITSSTARINGAVFHKGTQFVNTRQEVWGVWYPVDFVDPVAPSFTFFYKNTGSGPTPPPPVPPSPPTPPVPPVPNHGKIEGLIYLNQLLVSQMIFTEIMDLDLYLFWNVGFDTAYDCDAYGKGGPCDYSKYQRQPYVIERHKWFMELYLLQTNGFYEVDMTLLEKPPEVKYLQQENAKEAQKPVTQMEMEPAVKL